jgi:CDP-4-dehydro-6-deoxyglucose reductase
VPQGDIEIEVKEVAKVKEIEIVRMPTRVREKNMLADDVVQLFLSVPKSQPFDFLPGQYLNILLKNGKERSFSIANTPAKINSQGLELHIRVVPDGHYSPQVRDSVAVKDIIRIQAPFGIYFLRKDENQPIIMVAGGTGFAPIKALIEDAIEADLKQAITLYWGARAQADLYQNELAEEWAKSLDNFTYIPVLSEEDADSRWAGERGFVHEVIMRNHPDLAHHSIYASGPPVMIDALQKNLAQNRLDADKFYTDAFDYAAASE